MPRLSDRTPPTLPDVFVAERPRLLGIAYRLLGMRGDAEDVVQDVWLRWSAADQESIASPAAWLTTVTTRLAIDRLRQIDRRREAYVGPWLPEPVSTEGDPEVHAQLAESLTLGFLVLLDGLAPVERAVLLLADVFAEPYSVIAAAVGKSEPACRQIASRARRKVRSDPPAEGRRAGPASVELLAELTGALVAGDEEAVLRLVDPDVVLVTDGGPTRHAARRPVVGADRVVRLLSNLSRRLGPVPARAAVFNAAPAIVVDAPDGPIVVSGECRDGVVTRIWARLNPEKLSALDKPVDLR